METIHINNENILHLNFSNIPKIVLRNNLLLSLKDYFILPEQLEYKNIYIGSVSNNAQYNLTELLKLNNCNIITNILFMPNLIKEDYIIVMSIIVNGKKLVSFSNKILEILPNFNILDYFESRFIDINDFNDNVYLSIEYSLLKETSAPLKIGIYCIAFGIKERYKIKKKTNEKALCEHIRFYHLLNNVISYNISYESYKQKLLSNNSCLYNLLNNNTVQISIYKRIEICPIIYFSFIWTELHTSSFPKVKNITVIIDNKYYIEYNSTRINVNNDTNLHYIEFFPDNDRDYIKSNIITGINLNQINEIKIRVKFFENKANMTKINIGLLLSNNIIL